MKKNRIGILAGIFLVFMLVWMQSSQDSFIHSFFFKINFVPDTTAETIFPWEHVLDCLDNRLPAEEYKDIEACPKCNRHSEDLVWITFTSPPWTWKEHVGREGPLSICPECKIQVTFFADKIN